MNAAHAIDHMKTLDQLLEGLATGVVPALSVPGIAMDSRRIRAGWVFLACKGTHEHGMDHAAEACARGERPLPASSALYSPDVASVTSIGCQRGATGRFEPLPGPSSTDGTDALGTSKRRLGGV